MDLHHSGAVMTGIFLSKEEAARFSMFVPPKPVGEYKFDYLNVRITAPKKPRWFTRLMMRWCFQGVWRDYD